MRDATQYFGNGFLQIGRNSRDHGQGLRATSAIKICHVQEPNNLKKCEHYMPYIGAMTNNMNKMKMGKKGLQEKRRKGREEEGN